jgi:hypothetical protein
MFSHGLQDSTLKQATSASFHVTPNSSFTKILLYHTDNRQPEQLLSDFTLDDEQFKNCIQN